MSIHKLTAGSGYDYLTRQVAALDATDKGHTGLADYYSQRGEQPGVWVGSGMAGIDGLAVGDPVTAEQMLALFGHGLHPLAAQNRERLVDPDLTEADYRAVTRLGAPFRVYSPDVSPFRREVAARIAAVNEAAGLRVIGRSRWRSGRGCGRRWRPSSSAVSTAGTRPGRGSSPGPSRSCRGRRRRRSPAST